MNLLITTPTFYPQAGGAESFLADLAMEFAGLDHRVTVATRSVPGMSSLDNMKGIQIRRIPYPPQEISFRDLPAVFANSLRLFWKLFRMIRSQRIRIVCVGLVGIESVFIWLLTYLLRFRLIVFLHGSEIRSYSRISPLVGFALKGLLKRCEFAIAVSPELKEEAGAYQPAVKNKTFVIPCGVDIEKIREPSSHQSVRKYILFAGRLHPVKGIPTLIHAFHSVAADVPELDLRIAGTGPQEQFLSEIVSRLGLQDRVYFLGSRERSEIFSLIKDSEFVVLPSESEGSPLILLETLAAGKAVIASEFAGVREIVKDGVNGVLFPVGDIQKLSELILLLTKDARLREEIEGRIQRTDLKSFSIHEIARRHSELYLKPLKICLITASYYQDENCGGLSSYYFQLKQSLSKLGYPTHLITTRANGSSGAENTILVNTTWSEMSGETSRKNHFLNRIWSRVIFSYMAYREARKLDRSTGLDVIIAPELFAQGFFVGLFQKDKLVTRIHTPTILADYYNRRYSVPWISRALTYPEKMQARRSAAVTTASNHLADVVSRLWSLSPKKIHILQNGIDVQWVRDVGMNQKREVAGSYLLYFGRLERRKGVHVLSRALKEVLCAMPDIQMLWIGRDCGWKERIQAEHPQNREKFSFYDSMEKHRLFGFVRHAQMVILPSLFENFSNAGLEAMALERPIIATNNTGFSEFIQDGVNGFLVEPGNADALGLKIVDCLKRQDLQTIGRNAYATALQFEAGKIAEQNIALLREMLEL